MEYEEVIGKLQKYSTDKSLQDVETLLGYIYYEEENIEEILPIEFEDMEELLSHSRSVDFSLHDGADFEEATQKIIDELDFTQQKNIDTMIVKFIGGEEFDVEDVYKAFSPIEFVMNSSVETNTLFAATRDLNLKDRVMAIVTIASDGDF